MNRSAVIVRLTIILLGTIVSCTTPAVETPVPQASKAAAITIIHTNDTHAHLDDIAKRAAGINKIRGEAGKNNTLLLDAGDVFLGTLYFNLMKGQADLDFMSSLGYDAMTLGNHEFDNFDKTPKYLTDFIDKAPFPLVTSNIDVSGNAGLKNKTQPWVILDRAGSKFGIFGLITEETVEISNPDKTIKFKDHIEAARQMVAEFQKRGINNIIALTHIGWDEDIRLAQSVKGIDVIIGGHSHTLPKVYPTIVQGNEPTIIVQAECYGHYLGRLDLVFNEKGIVTSNNGTLIEVAKLVPDSNYTTRLAKYSAPIEEMKKQVVGKTLVDLDGKRENVRSIETNMGNLITDAMMEKASVVKAAVCILNGGSIRAPIPAGDISLGQILEVEPFNSDVVTVDISGSQLLEALENGVSQVESGAGRFPQVSGMRFSWDPKAPITYRVTTVEIKTSSGFVPLDKNATYRLVTLSFVAGGGDGYTMLTKGAVNYLGYVDYEMLREYIEKHSPLQPKLDDRIIRVTK
jgi:2',3'-cyclic-nucleotide 2'-phosphodiesterase (5'-nucleotidase family)